MKIEEYMNEVRRTRPDLGSDLNNQLHMAIGVATEGGELLDAYKKNFAYGKEVDKVNVAEEIGDSFWYLFNLCDLLNLDPEDIMRVNTAKLYERYPEKFTEEKAINRDLDKERTILEK